MRMEEDDGITFGAVAVEGKGYLKTIEFEVKTRLALSFPIFAGPLDSPSRTQH